MAQRHSGGFVLMENFIIETAKQMLGLGSHDCLDDELQEMLIRADSLVNKCSGTIRSRQVIASIIVFWENQ